MKIGITGTGSHIPSIITKNEDFLNHKFMETDGSVFEQQNNVIIEKFEAITGIANRRYAKPDLKTSDIGFWQPKRPFQMRGLIRKNWITSYSRIILETLHLEKFKVTPYRVWLLG